MQRIIKQCVRGKNRDNVTIYRAIKDNKTIEMSGSELAEYLDCCPSSIWYAAKYGCNKNGYTIKEVGKYKQRYKILDDDKVIFIGTLDEISEKFYFAKSTLITDLCMHRKLNWQYDIERYDAEVCYYD